MRVIAGTLRGRKLLTPEGMDTRPTTDRIKETLFNILQDRIPGARFLDLFAGSGQIGIEAVSRGASHAWLVDSGRNACGVIRKNIDHLNLSASCTLIQRDVKDAIRSFPPDQKFDIVFLDPPYREEREGEVLQSLQDKGCLTPESLVIIEASLGRDFSFAEALGFRILRVKNYKTNQHVFLSPER